MSVNKVILIGRVGKDPEVKTINSGKKVASFSMATSEYSKDKQGERQENTTWHNLIAWEKLAEISEKYIKKGSMIYVEGRISNRSYDDKDGVKKYVTEIIAGQIQLLDSKKENSNNNESQNHAPVVSQPGPDDDLPF